MDSLTGGATLIRRLRNLRTTRVFRHRNFSILFAGTLVMSAATFMMRVALGWLVLEMTDSPLSLGVAGAVHFAPHLIWGILSGAVADRFDRRKLLIVVYVAQAVALALMAVLIANDAVEFWHVLVISFVLGTTGTFIMTARQAFVVDIVGRDDAMPAISLSTAAMRVTGVFSGVGSGVVIEQFGVHWPFYAAAIGSVGGIIALLQIRGVKRESSATSDSVRQNFVEGLRIIGRNQIVLILLVMAIVCEILGFSYGVILPVFARDILERGASGLGVLTSVVSAGGLVAVLVLTTLGDYRHKGRLILGVFLFFGVFLVLFAQSPWYAASLVLVGLVGAMATAFDVLQHTMLQLNVGEGQRGRAMGIWQLGLGFGPIGSLMIGAVATALGARLAMSINGVAIVLVVLLLAVFVPRLRRA